MIRITPAFVSARRRRTSSRICAWIVTSSAVVGSSAISSRGSQESAIAIITRWRMPPDSSCGNARSRSTGRGMPTRSSSSPARSSAAALSTSRCARICSASCAPIRCTGLSAVIGSWKTIAISAPRIRRSSSSEAPTRSRPANATRPSKRAFGERVRPISVMPVTDLPEPDSPTIASTSPASTWKETPSTACTTPSSVRKETRSPSTSSRCSPAADASVLIVLIVSVPSVGCAGRAGRTASP